MDLTTFTDAQITDLQAALVAEATKNAAGFIAVITE